MSLLQAAVGLATPTPTPLPFNPDDVTPGVTGFLFTFAIFLLVGLIAWDLLRRVRNMRYRDEVRAKLEAEVAARAAAGEGSTAADAVADGSSVVDQGEASGGDDIAGEGRPAERD